jgi:hypothetical protein
MLHWGLPAYGDEGHSHHIIFPRLITSESRVALVKGIGVFRWRLACTSSFQVSVIILPMIFKSNFTSPQIKEKQTLHQNFSMATNISAIIAQLPHYLQEQVPLYEETLQPNIYAAIGVCLLLAYVCVGLRIYGRHLQGLDLWWDDYTSIIALVRYLYSKHALTADLLDLTIILFLVIRDSFFSRPSAPYEPGLRPTRNLPRFGAHGPDWHLSEDSDRLGRTLLPIDLLLKIVYSISISTAIPLQEVQIGLGRRWCRIDCLLHHWNECSHSALPSVSSSYA